MALQTITQTVSRFCASPRLRVRQRQQLRHVEVLQVLSDETDGESTDPHQELDLSWHECKRDRDKTYSKLGSLLSSARLRSPTPKVVGWTGSVDQERLPYPMPPIVPLLRLTSMFQRWRTFALVAVGCKSV